MVLYYFIMRIGDMLYYEYYPEGKDYPGIISIMVNGKGKCVLEVSKYPDGPEYWYWGYALQSLEHLLKKSDIIPLYGGTGWY